MSPAEIDHLALTALRLLPDEPDRAMRLWDEAWARAAAGGILKGQRYTGWTYALRGPQDKLNKPATIEITTEANAADTAVDDAATPIRVAADGVQLIYWAPLAPVIVPVLFLSRAKDH